MKPASLIPASFAPALAAILLCAAPAFAVDGTAINLTTNQPQAGVKVNLVQPGQQGMQQLGTATTGADGKFQIDVQIPPGPALLRSDYLGVTYTQALPPGTPTSGVTVQVYASTAEKPAGMRMQHLILLEPSATELHVAETFFTQNDSKVTYADPANGSVRLFLPQGVPDNLRVSIDSTGVPIQRPVEKGKRPGEYKIDYPLKPGETRMDLEYTLPASATFSGKVVSNDPPTRLVTPGSVTLTGDGIKDLGQEQSTQARVYTFEGLSYKVNILGVGSIRPQQGPQAESAEDNGAPKCCEEVPARINQQMPLVLGLSFAILAAGGLMLYLKGAA